MRPTDVCHPNDCVHPHLACSQLRSVTFAAAAPRGVLGSARRDWGTGRFTTSETASADRHRAREPVPHGGDERGRLVPTALTRPSLWHSCRRLPFHLRLASLRSRCNLAVSLAFGLGHGSESVETAKTTPIAVS